MQWTSKDIRNRKGGEKIAVLTAYDYPTAAILDESGIDVLLVGDSLGNVILGFSTTLQVTMEMMVHHCRAVSRGAKKALVVGDLPFGSYQVSSDEAVKNAVRLVSEGGVQAVKLEGGSSVAPTVERLVAMGIPVMAHIGLTPQSIHQLGGYGIHGKTRTEADRLLTDAKALERAGAFSVVLECVDPEISKEITSAISIPTIGIGSGESCDGQVLVIHDLLGYTTHKIPKFVKPLANLRSVISETVQEYIRNVKK